MIVQLRHTFICESRSSFPRSDAFLKADCTFTIIKSQDFARDATSRPAALTVFNRLTRISFPSFPASQLTPCLSFTLVFGSYPSPAGPGAKVRSAAITGVCAAHPRRTFAPSLLLLLPTDGNLRRCLGFLDAFKGRMRENVREEIKNL